MFACQCIKKDKFKGKNPQRWHPHTFTWMDIQQKVLKKKSYRELEIRNSFNHLSLLTDFLYKEHGIDVKQELLPPFLLTDFMKSML